MTTQRTRSTQSQIRRMVKRIVTRFQPDRVILFGSRARGDARPDSDVDLLVVMPTGPSKREAQLDVRSALHDIRMPVDVIVSRPEEYAWRKDVVGTIEWPASREGKILYARSPRQQVGSRANHVEHHARLEVA